MRLKQLLNPKLFAKFKRNTHIVEGLEIKDCVDSIKTSYFERIGKITLNRPHCFNLINLDMIKQMKQALHNYCYDPYITGIIIDSSSPNFSSGLDYKSIYEKVAHTTDKNKVVLNLDNMDYQKELVRESLQLVYKLHTCQKAIVSIIDGLCIGNAVPIGIESNGLLATKNIFCSPESGMGFFPYMGCCYHLSKISYRLGMVFALTGINYSTFELMNAKLFKRRTGENPEYEQTVFAMASLDPDISRDDFIILGKKHNPIYLGTETDFSNDTFLAEQISDIFSYDDIETVFYAIKQLSRHTIYFDPFWTQAYLKLYHASPLSLKVIFRYMKMIPTMTFEEVLKMDYRIALNFMSHPDFYRAIYKKNIKGSSKPVKWTYQYLDDVPDDLVDSFFKAIPGEDDIQLIPSPS